MTKNLVIGSEGFCGRHLVERLSQESGAEVVRVDRNRVPGEPVIDVDVLDFSSLRDVIRRSRPDRVFNLAGLAAGDAREVYAVNVCGGMNLLEAVRLEAPNARVLVVGSAAEYGDHPADAMPLTETTRCAPRTAYGTSKLAATLGALDYARRYGMTVVVARPFNIIGPGMPSTLLVGAVVSRIKRAAAGDGPASIDVGNTSPQRDFICVEKVVDAYVRLVDKGPAGEIFNICSGVPVSVQHVIDTLRSFAQRPVEVRQRPDLMRADDPPCVYGSWAKVNRAIGFTPQFDLEQSLRAAWDCGGSA